MRAENVSKNVAAVLIDVFFVNLRLRIARKLMGNVIVAEEDEGWLRRTSASEKRDKGK